MYVRKAWKSEKCLFLNKTIIRGDLKRVRKTFLLQKINEEIG